MMSDIVHLRLKEWFINMGYPRDTIPPDCKFKELCRGKYANVFEEIMRRVKAKEEVDQVRKQLFVYDMKQVMKNEKTSQKKAIKEPISYSMWKERKQILFELNLEERKLKKKEIDVINKNQSLKSKAVSRIEIGDKLKNDKRKFDLLKTKSSELKLDLKQLKTMCNMASIFDSHRNGWDANRPNLNRKHCRNPKEVVIGCLKTINEYGKGKSSQIEDSSFTAQAKTNNTFMSSNLSVLSKCSDRPDMTVLETEVKGNPNVSDSERLELYNYLDANMAGLLGDDIWPIVMDRQESTVKVIRDMASGNSSLNKKTISGISPMSTLSKLYIMHCKLELEMLDYKEQCKKKDAELLKMCRTYFPENEEEDIEPTRKLFTLRINQLDLEAMLEVYREEHISLKKRQGFYQCTTGDYMTPNVSPQESLEMLKNDIVDLDKLCIMKKVEIEKAISKLHNLNPKLEFVHKRINRFLESLNGTVSSRPRLPPPKISITITSESGFETNSSYEDFVKDLDLEPMGKSSATPAVLRSYLGSEKSKDTVKTQSATFELSFMKELDGENSCDEIIEMPIVTFADEIKYFDKCFPLEKNRKLCLDSGKSIWMKDSLICALKELSSTVIANNCYIINPLLTVTATLNRFEEQAEWLDSLERIQQNIFMEEEKNDNFDLSLLVEESNLRINIMKKKLTEVKNVLKKIQWRTEMINDPIQFWSSGRIKNYIDSSRTMVGRTYQEYENEYEAILNGRYDCPF